MGARRLALFLARRAVERAAIANGHALDHPRTKPAGLSAAIVNSEVILKLSRSIVRIAIVGKRRAAPANGVAKQPRNGLGKGTDLPARQPMRPRRRLDPRK